MSIKQVELVIPGDLKNEPIIYNIVKDFELVPNFMEASFSTEMGWVIVKFEGEDDELERLFAFLKEKGVKINFL